MSKATALQSVKAVAVRFKHGEPLTIECTKIIGNRLNDERPFMSKMAEYYKGGETKAPMLQVVINYLRGRKIQHVNIWRLGAADRKPVFVAEDTAHQVRFNMSDKAEKERFLYHVYENYVINA